MKKNYFICIIIAMTFSFFLFDVNVNASYYDNICNTMEIESSNGIYKDCGNNIVYLMEEIDNSSYLIADNSINSSAKILYVGKIDGLETFYSSGFRYYGVVYDDKNILTSSDNQWTDLSINGVVFYSGEFEDHPLFDESKEGFVNYFNEVGTYLIRQYIGNNVVNSIRVIVVSPKDIDVSIISAQLGTQSLSGSLLNNNDNLIFEINSGIYGVQSDVNVIVNECEFNVQYQNNLVVNNYIFNSCLIENSYNEVALTLVDGLERKEEFYYSFKLASKNVSIKLENSIATNIASSRRILIDAVPGMGKKLNEDYNLYYWSKSANDKLTYEDFMTNYENSTYKGSYTSNKGVILRNEVGIYYLYAMAKDDDSLVVVKSDEYALKKSDTVNKLLLKDVLFIFILCLGAVLPILIYLSIRGKDTK